MQYISNKVAYLKGLCEGLNLKSASKEGEILVQVLDVLDDISDALDGVSQAQNDLQSYVEEIDDDMTDLEDYVIGFDDDDDVFFTSDDDEADPADDDDLYEVECPACGHIYLTDFDSFEADDVICPKCNTKFTLAEDTVEKLRHAEACSHDHHE